MSRVGTPNHAAGILFALIGVLGPGGSSNGQLYAQTAYAAVWRPGTGAQWWRAGMSLADFKAQDQAYFGQGLRLVAVDLKGGSYAAVWRPGSGAQWWRAGMSLDDFKAQDKAYFDQGLRLVSVAIEGGKFTAVWRPGTGAQWWRSGMSLEEFKRQDQAYFDQGLRLSVVELTQGAYTAVWRPGTGAQWWRSGMTAEEFKLQDKNYFNQGLRLAALAIEAGHYTAVWRPGSGAQWWHSRVCFDDFLTEDKAYFDQGLRLEALVLHDDPVGLYKLPFQDDPGWKLFKGNYDDPGGGHPDTGLDYGNNQKFAFDFGHDANNNGIGESNQSVRAARSGVVYALANSENGNTWKTGTTEEGVKRTGPYPPGYSGVGNFLVIKHADGTFGTYWHLKQGSITVGVGDSVPTGKVVAQSDNSGNSSTPHLHFDVRRGWSLGYPGNKLEYPSVKILFQDKNHACWLPRVGNPLASNNY
jgi:murein DD-endopeptidase MepM/ murein hydrolase activator NlpD